MSTADSEINVGSIAVVNDIIMPIHDKELTEKTKLRLARLMTLLIGIFSVLIALKLKNIFSIILLCHLFFSPTIAPQLFAGFFYREGSSRTFMISAVTGAVVTFTWKFFLSDYTYIHPALPGIFANGIAFLLSRRYLDGLKWNQTFEKQQSNILQIL